MSSDNSARVGGIGLTPINSKKLYYRHLGNSSNASIVFIHGLGSSSEFYDPLSTTLGLDKTHSHHLLDLEKHGLSPTSATSEMTIESYASDFAALAKQLDIKEKTIKAHNMGCLIALALTLTVAIIIT